jgi:hypothetical protein
MIDAKTMREWRINYGLDRRSPEDAARWWGCGAPAGAVAALGLCLDEVERLRYENERLQRLVRDGVEHVLTLMNDLGLPSPEDYDRPIPVTAPQTRANTDP